MSAKLKRLHSPDIYNLEIYQPEYANSFCFLLQAVVGPEGEEGDECVDIEVCTSKRIEENLGLDEALVGQHCLTLHSYNYKICSFR
jgi:hypothetical protein